MKKTILFFLVGLMGLTAHAVDTDSDGMDDAWEQSWFGNLKQPADGDYDRDGRTNGEEETDGTSPSDPGSTLGLVAYYPFHANAEDASTNEYHGLVNGAVFAKDRYEIDDQAYSFDGIDDSIVANIGSAIVSNEYTFQCWIMFRNFDNDYPQIIIGENNYVSLGANGPAYGDDQGKISFYQNDSPGPLNRIVEPINSNKINTNIFYNITIVKGATNACLYMNGTLQVETTVQHNPIVQGTTLFFGGFDRVQNSMNGVIDDVRIYDRALSADEVTRLHAVTTPTDLDADKILDIWEEIYFDTIENCDPTDDPDGDLYTNLEEFINNTNPILFDTHLTSWHAIELGWKAASGVEYQVQASTNLPSGEWFNVGSSIVGNNSTNFTFDSIREDNFKAYRVIVVDP